MDRMVKRRRPFLTALILSVPTALVAIAFAVPGNSYSHQDPTFADDIGPLIQERCTMCHDKGGHGPFRISTYKDVERRATLVRQEILKTTMPPCYATSDVGDFCRSLPLTDEQIVQFQLWLRAGMPLGDEDKVPVAKKEPEGWRIPDPDMVVQPVETPVATEEGNPIWKAVLIDPGHSKTIRIRGFDIKPNAPQATRHILLAIASDQATENQWETQMTLDDKAEKLIGSWAPGYHAWMLPEGVSMKLEPGQKLVAQILFQPSGKIEIPQIDLALYLSENEDDIEPYWLTLERKNFRINPYDELTFSESLTLDKTVKAISIIPEARFFAYAMTTTATLPDGKTNKLFHTIRWTPYWVGNYMYPEPITLPKGTKITADIVYDNEEHSILNDGNRPKVVKSGNGLYDEVCRTHILVIDR